jgi:hypothetical protein
LNGSIFVRKLNPGYIPDESFTLFKVIKLERNFVVSTLYSLPTYFFMLSVVNNLSHPITLVLHSTICSFIHVE